MRTSARLALLVVVSLPVVHSTGCGLFLAVPDEDAGPVGVVPDDGGELGDAGAEDDDGGSLVGGPDAGALDDGGLTDDAGLGDAGFVDGGSSDGGLSDGGLIDGGLIDGGLIDGGLIDGGQPEPDPTVVEPIVTGGLRVQTFAPIFAEGCDGCADVDDDGLDDTFEDRLLRALRPVLVLHPEDPALTDGSVLHFVGRVSVQGEDPLALLVTVMIGWSEDYGSCGFTAHHGDSERTAVRLVPVVEDGVPDGTVDVTGLYTAAHENTISDRGRVFEGSTLLADLTVVDDDGTPRFALFPSRNKHATYGNFQLCDEAFALPCLAETCVPLVEGVLTVPDVVNAGEESAPRVSALDDIGFPGDDAWADQDFCGGLGGIGCSAPVREKLLDDPFVE